MTETKPKRRKPRTAAGNAASSVDARDSELDEMLKDFHLLEIASHLLRRAHFRAEEIFASQVGRDGLTPRQKALLIMAYRHPGTNQSELAHRIAIDRNSFTEMLARMVKEGFLTRRRAVDDARSNQIFITRRGIDAVKRIMPIDKRVEQMIVEPLPVEVRPLFISCLRMMLALEQPVE